MRFLLPAVIPAPVFRNPCITISATINPDTPRTFCIFEIDFLDGKTPHLNSAPDNRLGITEAELLRGEYSLNDILRALRLHNAIAEAGDFSGHITTSDGICIALNPAMLSHLD